MNPIPQSTCDRLKRLLTVHDQRTAAAIVGIHESMVCRIRRRGFVSAKGSRARSMPSDFPIQALHMSFSDLMKHYGAGGSTVSRWCKQIGRKPRWIIMDPLPVPSREELEAAIRKHGVTNAHLEFGCCRELMLRWRKKRDMPFRGKRPAPQPKPGWVERYVAETRA